MTIGERSGRRETSQGKLAKARRASRSRRDPFSATPRDIALARLCCHAFRRHVMGTFHVTQRELESIAGNGLSLTRDEKRLYVAQPDPEAPIWKVFNVKPHGTLDEGRTSFDGTRLMTKGPLPGP